MVTKLKSKTYMSVVIGILLAIILMIPITVWAGETGVTSENDSSLFIKEGGLPEAASEEIIGIAEREKLRFMDRSGQRGSLLRIIWSVSFSRKQYL